MLSALRGSRRKIKTNKTHFGTCCAMRADGRAWIRAMGSGSMSNCNVLPWLQYAPALALKLIAHDERIPRAIEIASREPCVDRRVRIDGRQRRRRALAALPPPSPQRLHDTCFACRR
eukprot:1387047-Pleurochrysis_carterae.AAC.1